MGFRSFLLIWAIHSFRFFVVNSSIFLPWCIKIAGTRWNVTLSWPKWIEQPVTQHVTTMLATRKQSALQYGSFRSIAWSVSCKWSMQFSLLSAFCILLHEMKYWCFRWTILNSAETNFTISSRQLQHKSNKGGRWMFTPNYYKLILIMLYLMKSTF